MSSLSVLRHSAFALLALTAGACSTPPPAPPAPAPPQPPVEEITPVRASVTDLAAFQAFIATQPSADAFRARYPGLQLVLPGQITTKEFRGDNSRYFAQLDAQGRITGGSFQ